MKLSAGTQPKRSGASETMRREELGPSAVVLCAQAILVIISVSRTFPLCIIFKKKLSGVAAYNLIKRLRTDPVSEHAFVYVVASFWCICL